MTYKQTALLLFLAFGLPCFWSMSVSMLILQLYTVTQSPFTVPVLKRNGRRLLLGNSPSVTVRKKKKKEQKRKWKYEKNWNEKTWKIQINQRSPMSFVEPNTSSWIIVMLSCPSGIRQKVIGLPHGKGQKRIHKSGPQGAPMIWEKRTSNDRESRESSNNISVHKHPWPKNIRNGQDAAEARRRETTFRIKLRDGRVFAVSSSSTARMHGILHRLLFVANQ